jgi:hypothetical protein
MDHHHSGASVAVFELARHLAGLPAGLDAGARFTAL